MSQLEESRKTCTIYVILDNIPANKASELSHV